MFTKNEFKNGDFVVTRNDEVWMFFEGFNGFVQEDGKWTRASNYNDDLTIKNGCIKQFDIRKVYRPKFAWQCAFKNYQEGELLFDRVEFKPYQEGELLFDRVEFKPYLYSISTNKAYGNLGGKTNQEAPFGEKLFVGDVVEVYNTIDRKNHGMSFIAKDAYNSFVMGLGSYIFKNGVGESWQIRKVRSYQDLNHAEVVDGIKVKLHE